MMRFPPNRRDLLKLTGSGVVGALTLSQTGLAADTEPGDELWRFEPDEENFPSIWSSPTVVDGTVYIGYRAYNRLYAIDAENGEQQWEFEVGHNVNASPTVVDGTVYVGSMDNSVYALDADSGTEQWTFETGGGVGSSPTVVDGTVFIGSWDGNVYSLDADSGIEQWVFETGGGVESSPTVVDGVVYVGSHDGNVYALDEDDGTEMWSHQSLPMDYDQNQVRSSPTVADGVVYVGSDDNNLYALDAETGDLEWSTDLGHNVSSSPTVLGGTVYVGTLVSTSEDTPHNVYALDANNGDIQWSVQVDYASVRSAPTVADDTVFIGSYSSVDESFYGLDANDGSTNWEFEPDGYIHASPTVVDGVVYIGDSSGVVYALDAGVDGSSAGSRVGLGTLGHHHEWADQTPTDVEVETSAATEVSGTWATLNGSLTTLSGANTATVSFEWGETGSGFSNATAEQTLDSTGTFDGEITGLDTATEYEFRAIAAADGVSATGETLTFTTDDAEPESLTVKTREVSDLDHTIATLNGELVALADHDEVSVQFKWGQIGEGLPYTTPEQTLDSVAEFDAELTDLDTATEYEFRAVAAANGESATGETDTFTTDEGCFIATAACGTADHDHVEDLRSFRDRTLKGNRLGELFVRSYYSTSPPIAAWIEQKQYRQKTIRTLVIRPAATLVSICRGLRSR